MAKFCRFLEGATLLLAVSTACSGDGSGGTATNASGGAPIDAGNGGTPIDAASGGAGRNSGGASEAGRAGGSGGKSGDGAASGKTGGVGGASTAGSGGTSAGGASTTGSGGASPGGAKATGGSGGTNASGGSPGTGGAAGAGGTACKRGIAANTPPGAAFFPAITWWYNWAISPSGANVGIEFTPMIWGNKSVNADIPGGSKYLLTFNEPNFHAQSNLTAQQAASYWPAIEAKAKAAHVPIVSPGMNFCGPAENCNGTNPYQYLKDFFAACSGCEVDYVAVHWYNCDLPSLRDYLEPGGNLEGFEQFGKPIWLTEFSCNGSASVANQETFMRAAVPYLESNSHVFRYSWFSAGPIPNAKLINDDGTPTALGKVYAGLEQSCH